MFFFNIGEGGVSGPKLSNLQESLAVMFDDKCAAKELFALFAMICNSDCSIM